MTPRERETFDAIFESVLASLPPRWRDVVETVSLVVLDRPSLEVLRSLDMHEDEATDLCGLHTGTSRTDRSVEDADLPSEIEIYREGIIEEAGGWQGAASTQEELLRVREQIRITLLHELGHELGLDEDDLDELGYQ
jgi:predicted Zn-dependent protease with MMP-like domain